MSWTDERVEILKIEWIKGLSCSQIARLLNKLPGAPISRNSVIGKIHRMGLSGTAREGAAKPGPATKSNIVRRTYAKKITAGSKLAPLVVVRPIPLTPPPIGDFHSVTAKPPTLFVDDPAAPRVAQDDLDSRGCKWPIGDPMDANFGFCGIRRTHKDPAYCDDHRALSSNPKQPSAKANASLESMVTRQMRGRRAS